MKKRYYLCCFIVLLLLVGCRQVEDHGEKNAIRIGISLYRGDDTFINALRDELIICAKQYEKDTGIKVTLDIQDAKGNQYTQNDQIERFISLGCDVLCINPVDRTSASVMIHDAMEEEIPVVFFNRQPVEEDLNRWDQLFYVGVSAKESAMLQAKIVLDEYRENKNHIDLNGDGVVSYVVLEGENSHQDSLIRTEQVIKSLKEGGILLEKITGDAGNWEKSQGEALMEQWLEKYPDMIELVISNNDDMALGAVEAIKRYDVSYINVVGIDGTAEGKTAVENFEMLGTVEVDKALYANAIFSIAQSVAQKQEIEDDLSLQSGKYYWCQQEIYGNNR